MAETITPAPLSERTHLIYEHFPGYREPPLVPLPAVDDLSSLEELGFRLTPLCRRIVNAARGLSGFRRFQKQLPQHVEDLLRRTDIRGANLFAPVIAATLALQDDPREVEACERAATLLLAARELYRDLTTGKLPQDHHGDQPLEMGQYGNLFATSLIVENGRARIFKSAHLSHVTVAVARRLYTLALGNPEVELSVPQVAAALKEIVQHAQQYPLSAEATAPGWLSAAPHALQCACWQQLEREPHNAASLTALRHSFLTLCLDLDTQPAGLAEAAFYAHACHYSNRWFHASLQIVVFGNARACAICNFNAYVDGNTMMRAGAELQKRAAKYPLRNGKPAATALPAATELQWRIPPAMRARAQREVRAVLDNQPASFTLLGLGREVFMSQGVEAVAVFIVALQMTAKRLTGKMAKITQFLSMSKYRCMDLVTAMVTTPEIAAVVEYLEGKNLDPAHGRSLLAEALASHTRACRRGRQHLPLDDCFALFMRSRSPRLRLWALFIAMLATWLLQRLGLLRPAVREIIVSHPEVYPEVALVGRPGVRLPYAKYFGLHYQILRDKTVITVMPAVDWPVPNAELIAVLKESWERLRALLAGPKAMPLVDNGRTMEMAGQQSASL